MSPLRNWLLRLLYKIAPFPIKGDLGPDPCPQTKEIISCVLCASNRPEDLEILLCGLSHQTMDKSQFEVVIVNDGGGDPINSIVRKYQNEITIIYKEHPTPQKIIGLLRNETIQLSKGKYLIFLDDDTRIMQNDFLEKSWKLLEETQMDVIIPLGKATFCIRKLRYEFFDPYSFGNAGVLYNRKILFKVGGFNSHLRAYEDIEIGIRLTIAGARMMRTDEVVYLHPPFYFDSMRKPISIGQSILQLRRHYSWLVWSLVFINALRFLPYGLIPSTRLQQWYKISLGVFLACFQKSEHYY